MKSYYRIMLGKQSNQAAECINGHYIGAGYGINQDLTNSLPEEWREFNHAFRPVYQEAHPGKSKIAAGLSCGFLWTISKGIRIGDIVLCPDGTGTYRVGEVIGDYYYVPGTALQHRREVRWLTTNIPRIDMSEALKRSAGSIGAVSDISGYREEIERLLGDIPTLPPVPGDPTVEDLASFALEKHLEDFLVQNWAQTELGKDYDIYTEEGEKVGQQYPSDSGPMDILAIRKDKKELLVVELKRGRASDVVVGQVLRYMGYVSQELAEEGQTVKGAIIAQEDDARIRRALAVSPNISFYRYQVSFKLQKV